jgi:hypothetical protein
MLNTGQMANRIQQSQPSIAPNLAINVQVSGLLKPPDGALRRRAEIPVANELEAGVGLPIEQLLKTLYVSTPLPPLKDARGQRLCRYGRSATSISHACQAIWR